MTHDRKIPSAQSLAIKEICVYFMNKTFFKATQAKYAHTHIQKSRHINYLVISSIKMTKYYFHEILRKMR